MQFKDVYGYEDLKRGLIQSVNENRVSHAQLFFGAEGSAKLALALAYAQYVSCQNRGESDSCGVCPSCRKYSHLMHPDLHFIYPVATTKEVDKKPKSSDFIAAWRDLVTKTGAIFSIQDWYNAAGITENKQAIINTDDAGEVIRTLSYKSYESEYKVLIMYLVEKMNVQSANTLLKVLEEPPAKTLFILVTEDPDQVLGTILSRTQLIKIPRYSDLELKSFLIDKYKVSTEQAEELVVQCEGNIAQALSLIDGVGQRRQIGSNFIDWLRECYVSGVQKKTGNYPKHVQRASEFAKSGRENQKFFLMVGLNLIRNVMQQHVGNPNLVKLTGDEYVFSEKFKVFVHPSNAIAFYDLFQEAIYHLERNANASLLFLDLTFKVESLLAQPKA